MEIKYYNQTEFFKHVMLEDGAISLATGSEPLGATVSITDRTDFYKRIKFDENGNLLVKIAGSAPPTVWSPASLTNLADWWSADTGVSLSGSLVNSWTGLNSNVLSPNNTSQKATFASSDSDMNSNPAIWINPSSVGSDVGYKGIIDAGVVSKTVIMPIYTKANINETSYLMLNSQIILANRMAFIDNPDFVWRYTDGINGQIYDSLGVSDNPGTFLLLMMQYVPGTSGKWFASNSSTFATAVNQNFTSSENLKDLEIGGYAGAIGSSSFKTSEVILINGIPTSEEITNLQSYFATKYGV
jgi:hypothetical protein